MFDLQYVISLVKQFRGDRRGVTALEYGLIASGVAVAIIAGVTLLGGNLQAMFAGVAALIHAPA